MAAVRCWCLRTWPPWTRYSGGGAYHPLSFAGERRAFTHRNGRTARWDATGTSYLILNPEGTRAGLYIPSELEIFDLPEEMRPVRLNLQWVTIYIGKGKKDKLSKIDIAGFLYKKEIWHVEEM